MSLAGLSLETATRRTWNNMVSWLGWGLHMRYMDVGMNDLIMSSSFVSRGRADDQ